MNIREATVRYLSFASLTLVVPAGLIRPPRSTRQVDDLLGMQNCNLHNLPENYTMRYCEHIRHSCERSTSH